MVEIKKLEKSFGKLRVLRSADVAFKTGGITAILGPNASGKTTLLKCILRLTLPDSGEIFISGKTIHGDDAYRSRIGYLPQIAKFPVSLTGNEMLMMVQSLRGVQQSNAQPLIEKFGLHAALQQPLRTLSGGTLQKINITLALLFDAPLLILDEPTSALDPVALIFLKELLMAEKQNGKTILLTTHSLGLVEELADEIVLMLEGKIYFKGSVAALSEKCPGGKIEYAIAQLMQHSKTTASPQYA